MSELGGLDILVNNAGKQHAVERMEDLTTEQFDATYKTNTYALFWLSKAALAHLPPGGAIINTASVEAYAPEPQLLDYASTKAAIVAFTKALAKQVAKRGIRVNAVAPGPVEGGPPRRLAAVAAHRRLGRHGQARYAFASHDDEGNDDSCSDCRPARFGRARVPPAPAASR